MSKLASMRRGPSGFLLHQHQQHQKCHREIASYTLPSDLEGFTLLLRGHSWVWLLVSSGPGTEPQKLLPGTQDGSFTNGALIVFFKLAVPHPWKFHSDFGRHPDCNTLNKSQQTLHNQDWDPLIRCPTFIYPDAYLFLMFFLMAVSAAFPCLAEQRQRNQNVTWLTVANILQYVHLAHHYAVYLKL